MNLTSARLILSCGAVLIAAAPASAATPSITGDAGAAVPLTAGLTLRHMAPDVSFAFTAEEQYYSARVVGPAGPASIGTDCLRTSDPFTERVRYQGNGTYTVFYKAAADRDACTAAAEQSVAFAINASTGFAAAPAKFLMRPAGSVLSTPLELAVNGNPGAEAYDVRFAAGATLGPDGGITGTPESAFVDMATGRVRFTFIRPGRYTMVVRAKTFRSDVPTAWGPPAIVTVVAPFDLSFANLSDSRGPTYAVVGTVREPSARGKVTIALGKGKNPRRFKRIGAAKIRKGGKFKLRFRHRQLGRYVMRFSYKGNATVAAGNEKRPLTFFKTFG
jgi:hypothetical protein